jgi:hypothetical protein
MYYWHNSAGAGREFMELTKKHIQKALIFRPDSQIQGYTGLYPQIPRIGIFCLGLRWPPETQGTGAE